MRAYILLNIYCILFTLGFERASKRHRVCLCTRFAHARALVSLHVAPSISSGHDRVFMHRSDFVRNYLFVRMCDGAGTRIRTIVYSLQYVARSRICARINQTSVDDEKKGRKKRTYARATRRRKRTTQISSDTSGGHNRGIVGGQEMRERCLNIFMVKRCVFVARRDIKNIAGPQTNERLLWALAVMMESPIAEVIVSEVIN